jgi:FAD/FMN-containing dehydrogenase
VITKLNILCEKIDEIRKIMVFKTDHFELILQSLPLIKRRLGKNLAALEYIDGHTYHTVVCHLHPAIFDKVALNDHMLFVQASTEELDALFEELKDFDDAIVSNNDKEYNKIWKIREDVAVAAVREKGRVLAYDISFDVRQWPGLL